MSKAEDIALSHLTAFFDGLISPWHEPLRALAADPTVLPPEHGYWAARSRAVQFGVSRWIAFQQPTDYPDDLTDHEARFVVLQDFLNEYNREALDPFGLLINDSWLPPHPYYEARLVFIEDKLTAFQEEMNGIEESRL